MVFLKSPVLRIAKITSTCTGAYQRNGWVKNLFHVKKLYYFIHKIALILAEV